MCHAECMAAEFIWKMPSQRQQHAVDISFASLVF
uniref:Uncharacterized protein n=1 Tax=viral metagenome TaxID=1070528 RepID=A0A6C0C2R9_9ZZZZ